MKTLWRWILPLIPLAALVYVGQVFFNARGGAEAVLSGHDFKTGALAIFPLYGLYAFTLLWFQLMLGSMMPWLRRLYRRVEAWHRVQGVFVLLFATLHPLYILIGLGFEKYFAYDWIASVQYPYLVVAYSALGLMYTTVLTALLRQVSFVRRWWRQVHVLNYLVFGLAWVHSWNLGTDTQSDALRPVWILFGVTAAGAGLWRLASRWRLASSRPVAPEVRYVPIAPVGNISVDRPFCANVGGRAVAIFKIGDEFFALDNECSHAGGSLCEGDTTGTAVQCPLHASRFDIRTGQVLRGPATTPQPVLKTRIQNGMVEVGV